MMKNLSQVFIEEIFFLVDIKTIDITNLAVFNSFFDFY